MTPITAGKSPFASTDYRPRTTAGRLLNGETTKMAKTNGNTPTTTTPKTPAAGMRFDAFGNEVPIVQPKSAPEIAADFGDGKPPVLVSELDAYISRSNVDPNASTSPDEPNIPKTEQPLPETVAPAVVTPKSAEPPHWYVIPEQRELFCAFVMGMIKDFGLFDRDEQGALKEWTCDAFVVKHQFKPFDYPTLTLGRSAIAIMLTEDFRRDLKAIMDEHEYPVDKDTFSKMIGHATLQDALQKMTGEGIRVAITGKIAAWEEAQHVAQVNANAQRTVDEQKPQQTAPEAMMIESAVIVMEDAPVTPKPSSVTVVKQQQAAIPYWQSPKWQVDPMQMADMVAKSGLYKGIDTAPKAFVVMMKGVELGISPMSAFGFIHLIPGSAPAPSGAFMLGMLRKSGVKVEFLERTETRATVRMSRVDTDESATVTWTIEQARRANLINDKSPAWHKYPIAMLTWRAVGDCARLIGTDILAYGGLSLYLREEIDETMSSVDDAA